MDKKEIWKDIKGYENIYQVSNHGRVKSLKYNKERILKSGKCHLGYLHVVLYNNRTPKTFHVHSLVATAFLNHKPCGHKMVVNHIDFDRSNNNVENLEITTQRENTNKKHLKSTSKYTGVYWNKTNKKWFSKIYLNGKNIHLGQFEDEYEAHLFYQKELKKLNL